jgi:hypothetical protein
MLPSFRVRRRARAATAVAASIVLLAALVPIATATGGQSAQSSVHLRKLGTTRVVAGPTGSGVGSYAAAAEIPNTDALERTPKSLGGGGSGSGVAAPNPAGQSIVTANSGFFGFSGLSHVDSRLASNGNQFSLEPPDQGLCVGNGYVVETINDVMAVYNTDGTVAAGPEALNAFYDYPVAIDRSANPTTFGPFMTDPKCLYDSATNRFFMSELTLETDAATGAFTGTTHVDLAVSQSGDPTGDWTIFTFDTTNGHGSLAGHPGCPCLGDQPLLGADANGIFISTNEFSFFGPEFNGAQLYAISKTQLAAAATGSLGTLPALWYENVGQDVPAPDAGGTWYSLQPATSPGQWDTSNGGTEYLLSALDFFARGDNRIAAWALTNTSSLNSTPDLHLQAPVTLASEPYVGPLSFGANQPGGQRPLAVALGQGVLGTGHPAPAQLEQLNANDDRMNQVVLANGQLWAGVNTGTRNPGLSAIAYFVVNPAWSNGTFAPTLAGQSYVAVAGGSVLFPSIGVNAAGKAVMTFTVVGQSLYPSVGYAAVTTSGAGPIHVAGAGAGPDDGFSGYAVFGGNGIARWGDYSAAVADSNGDVWIAAEYIPGGPRTLLANWGTFIGRVTP